LANQLVNRLHTQVRIVQQGARGRLEIEYFSADDLERLVAVLGGD
jgi:ParB family chromosome partitioning protein